MQIYTHDIEMSLLLDYSREDVKDQKNQSCEFRWPSGPEVGINPHYSVHYHRSNPFQDAHSSVGSKASQWKILQAYEITK